VSIIPLFGHESLQSRLRDMVTRGVLPHSILLHGPRGVGKQRLALWLGASLLCGGDAAAAPCGACQHCRYSGALAHPDLHWFFPRPRLKDSDADADEVREDYREAIADRVKAGGLYPPAAGNEGIFVSTVRALVAAAAMSPALARRKVFVVGDAERMVPQEGSEQAANALLKLLEEPPADTTLVLTTSEPGALLPTIRSRVVAFRIGPVGEESLRSMFAHPVVARRLDAEGAPRDPDDRIRAAAGAPGMLLGGPGWDEALQGARRLLDTLDRGDRADRFRSAFAQGGSRARGGFSTMLDALTMLLHQRVRQSALASDEERAIGAARAIEAVERTKELARGNVSPQLASAALLSDLSGLSL
jgi:DNA polymerase-3 subunit delta'